MFITLTLDEADRLDFLRVGRRCDVADDTLVVWPEEDRVLRADDRVVLGDDCIVRSGATIYAGCQVGERAQLGHHAVLRNHTIIGHDSVFGTASVSEGRVELGHHVMVETGCILQPGMVLEDYAFLGPRVVCANDRRIRWWRLGMREDLVPPRVRSRARVGAGAVLLPGVVVGVDAFVGAGAVVTRDVPDRSLVVGNPARVVPRTFDLDEDNFMEVL